MVSPRRRLYKLKDKTGFRQGKLTVVSLANPDRRPMDPVLWNCLCDCGKTIVMSARKLTTKACRRSCGCTTGVQIAEGGRKRRKPRVTTMNNQYRSHLASAQRLTCLPLPRDVWQAMATLPCYYCGCLDRRTITPCHKPRHIVMENELEAYAVDINGIDRVDTDRGYEPDNCVPCCRHCNVAKNGYTQDQFYQRVKRVYERHNLHLVESKPIPYRTFGPPTKS